MSPHTVTRDIAQAGLMRVIGTAAFAPPCVALVQVLANSQDYRQPAIAVAVWLGVLGAAVWLVPKVRAGDLPAGPTAAAIAIALAAVVAVGLARQPRAMPGSVDLAILGTVWLLVLVVVSHSARVWLPATLTVFAAHSVLLLSAEGLNRLSLSELEAAAYITAALLIAFATLRPTLAVHAGMAARQSSLASRSAAERAAADAIGQERRSRLALLEREALPLLRGIADGTLDATTVDVRGSCARHAAALRHSLNGRPPGAGELAAGLEPALRGARERGLLVDVQLIGDPGSPPPPLAGALLATVRAVLDALPPHQVTLTVLAAGGALTGGDLNSGDLNDSDLNSGDLNSGDLNSGDAGGDHPEGNDVELYLTFDAPLRGVPELTRSGLDLPAAARWHAAVRTTETAGGYLEVSWRKDGAM
ncbi:MAG: pentapeptide repeat-containing protein [Trebonia sp.]